jgi:ankyrin repeat protein
MAFTDRYTPLLVAAENGNIDMVKRLLPNKNID